MVGYLYSFSLPVIEVIEAYEGISTFDGLILLSKVAKEKEKLSVELRNVSNHCVCNWVVSKHELSKIYIQ